MTTHRQTQPTNPTPRAASNGAGAQPSTPAEGHSRFAKRGQSHEERMPDDDSASKFPELGSRAEPPVSTGERSLAAREGRAVVDGRLYGSGGSYGYGGAFEHGGQRGYDVAFAEPPHANAAEDRYEATGGFGHDTEGYQRAGLGHPGKDERRPAPAPAPVTDGAPASGHPEVEDARHGYSQESGYVQSGGNPTPDDEKGAKKKAARKTN